MLTLSQSGEENGNFDHLLRLAQPTAHSCESHDRTNLPALQLGVSASPRDIDPDKWILEIGGESCKNPNHYQQIMTIKHYH